MTNQKFFAKIFSRKRLKKMGERFMENFAVGATEQLVIKALKEANEDVNKKAALLKELVDEVVGDKLDLLDSMIHNVSVMLSNEKELTNQDLNRIILQLPLYVYELSDFIQKLEIRISIAEASQNEDEANATLTTEGTVATKQARSRKAGLKNYLIYSAYKGALTMVKNKMNTALELLAGAKKVQSSRMAEIQLSSYSKIVE